MGEDRQPIRLFLLDDHEIVRRGLRDVFESEADFVVVGDTASAIQAERRLAALRPDVAIIDVRLLDGNGIDVCRAVRARHPETRVVILTSYDDDEALFASIMAGASGYVLKQVRGPELIDAVRRVAAGQSLLDPAVTAAVLERLRRPDSGPDDLAALTPREQQILLLIADGLTNRQIAGQLYLAEKTIKNHVSAILAKLGLERRTQAAVLAAKLRP